MNHLLQKRVWMGLAAVAFVAHGVPHAWGEDCGRECCAAEAHESCSGCCQASSADVADPPCHCQLDARDGEPFSLPRNSSNQRGCFAQGAVGGGAFVPAPHVAGESRDHEASVLAMPIRPVRILYGVWRN